MADFEVLYDWNPENSDEISLTKGERIMVLEKGDHGWWLGVSTSGTAPRRGYFPRNYVRPVRNEEPPPPPPPRPAKLAPLTVTSDASVDNAVSCPEKDSSDSSCQGTGRPFSIENLDTFDSLVDRGIGVEVLTPSNIPNACMVASGMTVNLECSALTWDGATTEIQVFVEGPLSFHVGAGQVTVGLEEGVQELHVGDVAHVICAPSKAYGDAGQPPCVPPNSHVVYVVKVLSAKTETQPSPAAGDPMFLFSGISTRRDNARASQDPLNRRANVVLDLGDGSANSGKVAAAEHEITDEMLAQAARSMGM